MCVALLVAENTFHIYANVIDDRLRADLEDLKKAATSGSDDKFRQDLLKKVQDAAEKEARLSKGNAKGDEARNKRKVNAERRFNKVMNFLSGTDKDITQIQVHQPETENKHAEMRAADAAVQAMPEGGSGSVGNSKLCCGNARWLWKH